MSNDVLEVLEYIPADISNNDWVVVGMALKAAGYSCDVWDRWSQSAPSKYKRGECEKRWRSFSNKDGGVTVATLFKMAKDNGYDPRQKGYEWDDEIARDGDEVTDYIEHTAPAAWDPVEDLKTFLRLVYEPSDIVGYVVDAAESDGKWRPSSKGYWDRTAAQLIEGLERHPNDIKATIGDTQDKAGAWIRFNPLDGVDCKNDNVTAFRYALVESDEMPISEQEAAFRRLELPIVTMVHSGGKSLHALVKVDAPDYGEYRKRVDFLYEYLSEHGVIVDKQNRNPARMTRMPGVMRAGVPQRLIATNIGRKSWIDWMDFVEGTEDSLPEFVSLSEYDGKPPVLPPVLIEGILRDGHKMLISGSSKAGKSFLLMELAIAIANGREWIGHKCGKGGVLYVNLEIDPNSFAQRFIDIHNALGIDRLSENITIWNLRGEALPLDKLAPKLIRRMRNTPDLKAVILDPIYKIITGDENNASEMGAFCNQFDKIAKETGCAVIYCHHHSKGAQGAKRAMDRASGSGVFARDPDAQLDLCEIELTDSIRNEYADAGATAWRVESSLREFPNIEPVNLWFNHPIHEVDKTGILATLGVEGSALGNLAKTGNFSTEFERRERTVRAYELNAFPGTSVTVEMMAASAGVSVKTMQRNLKDMEDTFNVTNRVVVMLEEDD